MGPVYSTEAHRARLARCVYFATAKVEGAQSAASFADCADFRMGRRIVVGSHPVYSGCDDFISFYDDGTERAAAVFTFSTESSMALRINSLFPIRFVFSML